MAIQMTREEYKQKYGFYPIKQSFSELDDTPSPRRMTRAEYDAEFNSAEPQSWRYQITKPLSSLLPNIKESASRGIEKIKTGFKTTQKGVQEKDVTKGIAEQLRGAATEAAGAIELIFSPFTGALSSIGQTPLTRKTNVGELIQKPITEVSSKLGDQPWLQNLTTKYPELPEDVENIITIGTALWLPETAKKTKLPTRTTKPKISPAEKIINKRTQEIYNIENSYKKIRDKNAFIKDEGNASRARIAETDVLVGSVDDNGIIRTKQPGGAIDQYKQIRLEGTENIVKNLLTKEGKKVNVKQVENYLKIAIEESGLEGADYVKAINGITKEIDGVALKYADEFGNIPLDKVQDIKISTTKNINYLTDSTPTIRFRKAKASAYRQIIEDNSNLKFDVQGKKLSVKDINAELGKFLDDIDRLASLDGRRVRGGKLGKYFSQISGNIIGGAAGSMGGAAGTALGTIVGGEVAGLIKGRQMAGTFGRARELPIAKNPTLESAKAFSKKPKTLDLRTPDKVVGAPKNLPKTPEITKTEGLIRKNVKQQKKAIAQKDFTLVAKLKEIYQTLIERLRELIRGHKDTPNKEGGFVKIGKETPNTSFLQEAKKYKSAEEFVKAKTNAYHGTNVKFNEFTKESLGLSTGSESAKKGFFFTDNTDVAKGYGEYASERMVRDFVEASEKAEKLGQWDKADELMRKAEELSAQYSDPVIIESFLDLKNPLVYDAKGKGFLETDKKINDLIDKAKKEGYDALIVKNLVDNVYTSDIPSTHTVVFDNKSIKTKFQLEQIWKEAQKDTPNKEGGFVRIGQSNKDGNLNAQYKTTAKNNNTPIPLNDTTKMKLRNSLITKDIQGNRVDLKAGQVIGFAETKGSNYLLNIDGEPFIVNKNQFQNLKNQSVVNEAKEFAPELKGTEENTDNRPQK